MKLLLLSWKTVPALLLYFFSTKECKHIIEEDMYMYIRWEKEVNEFSSISQKLCYCLINLPSYRNVFYFRIRGHRILDWISKTLLRPIPTIEISGEIDSGLYIPHNNAVVCVTSAGKNLNVKPGVVIGEVKGVYPVIGDNVLIGANASIIGNIIIGSDVVIGAGTVVINNVPDHCTVVGNPGRII